MQPFEILVSKFYDKVLRDELLGEVFSGVSADVSNMGLPPLQDKKVTKKGPLT